MLHTVQLMRLSRAQATKEILAQEFKVIDDRIARGETRDALAQLRKILADSALVSRM